MLEWEPSGVPSGTATVTRQEEFPKPDVSSGTMRAPFVPLLFTVFVTALSACGSDDASEQGGTSGSGGTDAGAPDTSVGGAGQAGQAGAGGSAGTGAGATGGTGGTDTGGSGGTDTGGTGGTDTGGTGGTDTGGTGGTGGTETGGTGGTAATGGTGGTGGTGTAPTCGDGTRNQSWEQCDGFDLGGATCAALVGANYTGSIACTSSCTYDTQACVCSPHCSGKECGSDGCGSTCGPCPTYASCTNGQCVCADACGTKECGTNLCGEACGTCPSGAYCNQGQCVGCTPTCDGKSCGPDTCGNVCGICGPEDKCSSGVCSACTKSCPTLTPAAASSSTQCVARMDDCNACGPASCGTPHYAYGCWGGDTPPLAGCFKTTSNEYCCPQAACLRYTVADSYCTGLSLPPHAYSCKPGVTPGASCVLYPANADGPVYCCP